MRSVKYFCQKFDSWLNEEKYGKDEDIHSFATNGSSWNLAFENESRIIQPLHICLEYHELVYAVYIVIPGSPRFLMFLQEI